MSKISPSYVSSGNINPSVFVIASTSADFTVTQCSTNGIAVGISQEGTKYAPGIGPNAYAAEAGDNIRVYGIGEVCMLTLGGTVAAGDYLKSDSSGFGVTIAGTGATAQYIGARALEAGVSGNLIRVEVLQETKVYPALS